MCVSCVNMTSVTTREVQHHLAKVLRRIAKGEEVAITLRGKPIALIRPLPDADPRARPVAWTRIVSEVHGALGDVPAFREGTVDLLRAEERS